jgi:hypothetical protein
MLFDSIQAFFLEINLAVCRLRIKFARRKKSLRPLPQDKL